MVKDSYDIMKKYMMILELQGGSKFFESMGIKDSQAFNGLSLQWLAYKGKMHTQNEKRVETSRKIYHGGAQTSEVDNMLGVTRRKSRKPTRKNDTKS